MDGDKSTLAPYKDTVLLKLSSLLFIYVCEVLRVYMRHFLSQLLQIIEGIRKIRHLKHGSAGL